MCKRHAMVIVIASLYVSSVLTACVAAQAKRPGAPVEVTATSPGTVSEPTTVVRVTPVLTISESTLSLLSEMRNSDVDWDIAYAGLYPIPEGATLQLVTCQEDITPLLIDALADEDRFVAAHVVLGLQTRRE